MKLISALLSESKSGIFDGKTYLDDATSAMEFEKGYEA